ncbi:hypothetical protein [Caulobacter sp. 1776]|uniref:hypothetical protein n=1 Tax=Caulobacter sp. 1776 TaxID=3156420 RepID=UPI0033973A24
MIPELKRRYTCPVCRATSKSRKRFKNHLYFQHGLNSAGVAGYRNPAPPRVFRAEVIDAG